MRSRRRALWGAVIVILVLGSMAWLLLGSDVFTIKNITIQGGERTQRQLERLRELIGTAGVRVGGNIFRVDLERARRALLRLPWVRQAELHRRLPGSVEVRLSERVPFLVVRIAEASPGSAAKLFWVDRSGYLIEPAESSAADRVLTIGGVKRIATSEGPRLDSTGSKVIQALAALAARDPGFVAHLRDLQITPLEIILKTRGGLRVIMEVEGLGEQLERLRRLLAVINEGHYLYIDLRFGDLVMMPR